VDTTKNVGAIGHVPALPAALQNIKYAACAAWSGLLVAGDVTIFNVLLYRNHLLPV
jgi:hypothetical protein